ncbi:retroviral-like aspartic protease family protein [Congregibacter brevis]|uniref:Retroviral-like aspartic protease family protein n=1 Tax=Congregibacter brevis TaxID=3081201 RepID=A0ABZ0ID18_9GAMM|nr:retroviral-like aspartic protease family protein [Congregibacter sp. IMCC45268]
MLQRYLSALFFVSLFTQTSAALAEQTVELPLSKSSGGALELSMVVDGQPAMFLLDTGAAIVTINSAVFASINDRESLRKVRQVAAKMADGRTRRLDVYEIEALHLVGGCDIGLTEVLVVPGSGRNLMGLNALAQFAPLTLSMDPPALGLSNCTKGGSTENAHVGLSVASSP